MNHEPNDEQPHVHAFAIPVPESIRRERDRERMEAEERLASVDRFLDSLNVEQLMALRYVLNQDKASAMNNYFDGQVVTLMRRVHGVDAVTGLTPQQAFERQAAGR
jgi:hypothetical protein